MPRATLPALALSLAAIFASSAQAALYKWTDAQGHVVYSDQPPPDVDSKQIRASTGTASSPEKTAVERDKEAQKGRKDAAEKAKKGEEDAQRNAQNEARCAALKSNYQMYVDGGRIQRTNDKGERELMSDAEIEAAREKTRREMDEACKK